MASRPPLRDTHVVTSPLSGEIYLVRGKVKQDGPRKGVLTANSKREATAEVAVAFCRSMLHGMPDGAKNTITLDGREYEITVRPTAKGVGPPLDHQCQKGETDGMGR